MMHFKIQSISGDINDKLSIDNESTIKDLLLDIETKCDLKQTFFNIVFGYKYFKLV